MTLAPSSPSQPGLIPIPAQVKALACRTTDLGNRIYAVFNTVDGATLGFWDHADHPVLRSLNIGDSITLYRKPNGHLTLLPPTQPKANQGLMTTLKRLWPWR
ncbi:MAG: hypothetical protein AB4042_00295 [Leptolyngbyaceae cyanobacterium]